MAPYAEHVSITIEETDQDADVHMGLFPVCCFWAPLRLFE